jgi:putative hydrolase of HD superfamily
MENLARFIFELGTLKRIRRAGWWVAGRSEPESVAEHCFRVAVLGFILATLQGADPFRTAAICLFHDIHETRLGDPHRINRRYLDYEDAERRASKDQIDAIPQKVRSWLSDLFDVMIEDETAEAQLARDADILECLVQAREYQAQGCTSVSDWIQNSYSELRSPGARKIAEVCMAMDPKDWWHRLRDHMA